ncbi:MAG: hypothetical protein LBR80_10285 [Deltaproteobacteria bacterium]|nr:hypothetical protein [Deltaproteobacteria bacterium]
MAKRFRITVVPREDAPSKAARITYSRVRIPGSSAECPGISCIRTNYLSQETEEALKRSFSLTDVVSVFRRL